MTRADHTPGREASFVVDDAFRGRCLRLARQLSESYAEANPPFDLKPLRDRYRVGEVRERALDRDARLLAMDGAFTIEVNSMVSLARRRMSIAHEFGHLIIDEVAGGNSFAAHSHPEVERLCNILAGELICPERAVLRHFSQQCSLGSWRDPIRCQSLIEAARTFEVSVDVMARRVFFDLRLVPSSVALVWRFSSNTKGAANDQALRVASAWHSLGQGTFVPLNKTARPDSVVTKAFQREGSFCGTEKMQLGTVRGTYEVEASGFMSFPMRSRSAPVRAVLSVLR